MIEITLLSFIASLQVVTFIVVLIGTNFLDRAWQLGTVGKMFSRSVRKLLKKSSGEFGVRND